MIFFDTYALWEIKKNNPQYRHYLNEEMAITQLNIYEFYNTLRRENSEKESRQLVASLSRNVVNINTENIFEAVELKRKNKELSFVDALGYTKAKDLGIKFLTGDKAFKDMPNVEFVQ